MAKSTITGVGTFGNTEMQVDPTHRAARVSLRPNEKGVYGSYRAAFFSGLVAAGMAGPLAIFEMRWTPATVNGLIKRLRFMAVMDATGFAQGSAIFSLFKATKFTALDTTGAATAPTLAGKDQAKSTRQAASQLQSATAQNFAILNTAATGLTGGTKTLDSNAMALLMGNATVITTNGAPVPLNILGYFIDPCEAGREPEELQANEGLVIRCESVPATGTWKFGVEVEWDEIDPARYFLN